MNKDKFLEVLLDFQEFFLSLGMGKRLSPEEKEARLKAYMEHKAEKAAKRKARLEEIERRRKERELRKKAKRGPTEVSVDPIRLLKPFEGDIKVGDTVAFRWPGFHLLYPGVVENISKEQAFRVIEGMEEAEENEVAAGYLMFYEVKAKDGCIYTVLKNDIKLKKINNKWQAKLN